MNFQKVGLITKKELLEKQPEKIKNVISILLRNHITLYVTPRIKNVLKEESFVNSLQTCNVEDMPELIELGICCGGDGTLLHMARSFINKEVPIIGIHYGRFGFLMDLSCENLEEKIQKILAGQCFLEKRLTLETSINGTLLDRAFNDILLHRGVSGRLTEFLVTVDNHPLPYIRADGIIIATPTGSTAYNLSAHGSILHPATEVFIMTPVCSHYLGLMSKPIVLPSSSMITIKPIHKDVNIQSDGQGTKQLKDGEILSIRAIRDGLQLVHPEGYSYIDQLSRKFAG